VYVDGLSVMCARMDNHNRSKKHADNVARLLLELGEDDDADDDADVDDVDNNDDNVDDDNVHDDDDDGTPNAADVDDDEVADDLPDLSQTRYFSFARIFCLLTYNKVFKKLEF